MAFGVKMGASDPREAYVYASQSLRCAKTSLPKVCVPSSHPYPPLVLISTPQCITGLRTAKGLVQTLEPSPLHRPWAPLAAAARVPRRPWTADGALLRSPDV